MKIVGIDQEKCIECKECIRVCPSKLFLKEEKGEATENSVSFSDPHRLCVRCGHCIAICPTKAIIYEEAEAPFTLEETTEIPKIVPYEDLLKILRMRRSIRVYQDKPVPREKIEKILEAMRYAPSASNRQAWRYIVLTDKEEIAYFSDETMKLFKRIKRLLPFRYLIAPFLPKSLRKRALNPKVKIQVERVLKEQQEGEDPIFFKAPCVIILYSRDYGKGLPANDAGIAFTHGMLAAQALGLGSCWIGFAQQAMHRNRGLRKHFQIPKGYKVWGVLTLGTPDVNYKRGPPRRPLRVRWVD